jgi:putative intracellular protease/amidase
MRTRATGEVTAELVRAGALGHAPVQPSTSPGRIRTTGRFTNPIGDRMKARRAAIPCLAIVISAVTISSLLRPGAIASAQESVPTHTDRAGTSGGKLNVAVLLYDGALVLDYGIAAEMFLAADFMRRFNVYTVSGRPEVRLSILRSVHADFGFGDAPPADILIVPGGPNWAQAGMDEETRAFLRKTLADGGVLYSVCTGALLLGKAGLLDGRTVTTNHQAAAALHQVAPRAVVVVDRPFIDDGTIVTAAGAGTAIEATLHVVERFASPEVAHDLGRRYLDYPCMSE